MILGLISCPAIYEDEGNHQEQVRELIKQTAASIDDLALKTSFITHSSIIGQTASEECDTTDPNDLT